MISDSALPSKTQSCHATVDDIELCLASSNVMRHMQETVPPEHIVLTLHRYILFHNEDVVNRMTVGLARQVCRFYE